MGRDGRGSDFSESGVNAVLHEPAGDRMVIRVYNGVRTQAEVARIMTARGYPMTRSNVYQLERAAIRKIKRDLTPWLEKLRRGDEEASA